MVKERNVALDLLRITCMLLIVLRHSIGPGGVSDALQYGSTMWYVIEIIMVFTIPAVNCLVLISGYFLCTSRFKLSKLVSLWVEVCFYSVGTYLVLVILPVTGIVFSLKELIKCCLVFTMDRYWFVTDYFFLYMTFPFLNYAIHGMDKKVHFVCCVTLVTIFSVLPNIFYVIDFTETNEGYSYIWFCVLYMLAAYIRLYFPVYVKQQKKLFVLFIGVSLVICGERFVADLVTPYIFGHVALNSYFYAYNSIVSLLGSLILFQAFRGLEIKSLKSINVINFFAPLTFSVYLIHEQANFKPILWEILKPSTMVYSGWLIPYLFVCVICIFVVCCVIDYARRKVFKNLGINQMIKKITDQLQKKANIMIEKYVERY